MTTPTPTGSMAAGTANPPSGSASSAAATSSPGSSPVAVFALEILGVVILAIVAGIGPRVGRIVVMFTAGILVLWLVLNAATLKRLIPGTNVAVQG